MALLISGINLLYVANNDKDSLDVKRFDTMPETIDVCNLGSSHGRSSFYYINHPGIQSFNFAFIAQSLSYDYRLLAYYQDRLTEGSIVFIPISYFSFFGIDETELSDFVAKNKRYYPILPKNYIKEYDFISYLCTVPFPAVGAGTNMISAFLKKNEPSDNANTVYTTNAADAAENASGAYWRHLVNNRQDENGNLILQDGEVQAVYDIIDLCRSKNAIPILVTTPFLQEYTDYVMQQRPDYLPYFYDIVNRISEDTNTPYLDYAFDERFKNDYSLFKDCDHLNENGAILFTDIVLNDIKDIT